RRVVYFAMVGSFLDIPDALAIGLGGFCRAFSFPHGIRANDRDMAEPLSGPWAHSLRGPGPSRNGSPPLVDRARGDPACRSVQGTRGSAGVDVALGPREATNAAQRAGEVGARHCR